MDVQTIADELLTAVQACPAELETAFPSLFTERWCKCMSLLHDVQVVLHNALHVGGIKVPVNLSEAVDILERQRRSWRKAGDGWGIESQRAAELLAGLCKKPRVQLEDFAGKLSRQQGKLLSLLWKARGHKMSLDTVATKLWPGQEKEESAIRKAIDRLKDALLESPVSVATKGGYAVLDLPDK